MNLIVVFLSLVLERHVGRIDERRRMDWFPTYVAWVYRRLNLGGVLFRPAGPLLILAPILVLVQFGVWLVEDGLFGLLSMALGVLVLLYCYGPRNLEREVDDLLEAVARNELDCQRAIAANFAEGGASTDPLSMGRAVADGILVEANSRLFAAAFWFLVLGPLGAVMYRFTSLLWQIEQRANRASAIWAMRLLGILDWVPTRALVLGYAVMGSFDGAFAQFRKQALSVEEPVYERNRAFLREAGRQALLLEQRCREAEVQGDPELPYQAAMDLVVRSVLGWLGLLAVLAIVRWSF